MTITVVLAMLPIIITTKLLVLWFVMRQRNTHNSKQQPAEQVMSEPRPGMTPRPTWTRERLTYMAVAVLVAVTMPVFVVLAHLATGERPFFSSFDIGLIVGLAGSNICYAIFGSPASRGAA